jgi:hypothetical protein
MRAEFRAEARDAEGAAADIMAVHRAAMHLHEQPTLIGLLVAIANHAIAAGATERMLPLALKDAELSAALRGTVESMPESWDLSRPMMGEAFFAWWIAVNANRITSMVGGWGMSADISLTLASKSQFVVRSVQMSVLDVYTPFFQTYKPGDDERKAYEAIEARMDLAVQNNALGSPILEVFRPVFANVSNSLDRARSRRRSLLAALDVIDFRHEHGKWPTALPVARTDPFDGKPLRYKLDGDGFRIWSVGMDKSDDGGKKQHEAKGGPYDEVLVYPRKK